MHVRALILACILSGTATVGGVPYSRFRISGAELRGRIAWLRHYGRRR